MLQFIRALNLLYVLARRYKLFCTHMADSLRDLRTVVREWECCMTEAKKAYAEFCSFMLEQECR